MGLDMLLLKKTADGPEPEKVIYWRKANAIHGYFIDRCHDGVDNQEDFLVSTNQLEDLCDRMEKILSDHSLAEELLPTMPGFFFGSTEYDHWYYEDLETTIPVLRSAISEAKPTDQFVYSCWW